MHAKTHQRATRSMRGRASAGALALLVLRPDLLRQDLVQPRELRPPAQARSEAQSQLWMAGVELDPPLDSEMGAGGLGPRPGVGTSPDATASSR
jgi:hypothetical protein